MAGSGRAWGGILLVEHRSTGGALGGAMEEGFELEYLHPRQRSNSKCRCSFQIVTRSGWRSFGACSALAERFPFFGWAASPTAHFLGLPMADSTDYYSTMTNSILLGCKVTRFYGGKEPRITNPVCAGRFLRVCFSSGAKGHLCSQPRASRARKINRCAANAVINCTKATL